MIKNKILKDPHPYLKTVDLKDELHPDSHHSANIHLSFTQISAANATQVTALCVFSIGIPTFTALQI